MDEPELSWTDIETLGSLDRDGTDLDIFDLPTARSAPDTSMPGENGAEYSKVKLKEAKIGCVLFRFQTTTINVTHQACLLRRLHYNFLKQFGQEVSFDITVVLSGRVMQISKAKGSAPVVYTLGGIQRPVIMSTHTESGKLVVTGAYLDGITFHAAQDEQIAVEHLVVLESSKQTAEQNRGSCVSGQLLVCICSIGVCRTQMQCLSFLTTSGASSYL